METSVISLAWPLGKKVMGTEEEEEEEVLCVLSVFFYQPLDYNIKYLFAEGVAWRWRSLRVFIQYFVG